MAEDYSDDRDLIRDDKGYPVLPPNCVLVLDVDHSPPEVFSSYEEAFNWFDAKPMGWKRGYNPGPGYPNTPRLWVHAGSNDDYGDYHLYELEIPGRKEPEWAGLAAALKSDPDSVPLPRNAGQAKGMILVGDYYLRGHEDTAYLQRLENLAERMKIITAEAQGNPDFDYGAAVQRLLSWENNA